MEKLQAWLQTNQEESGKNSSNTILLMSVGGSFDFISGKIQRAPLIIRTIGLEWLWRLIKEPWRWRRQLALVHFILRIFQEKALAPVS